MLVLINSIMVSSLSCRLNRRLTPVFVTVNFLTERHEFDEHHCL